MPTIAWFYGIAILMYHDDHNPPHLHTVYGEHEAKVSIATGEITEGRLPTRAARLVREWCEEHRSELMSNWSRARAGIRLERIKGLDAD